MIDIELGEMYGMDSYKDLVETINYLKRLGFTDNEIQKILDKSKNKSKEGAKMEGSETI